MTSGIITARKDDRNGLVGPMIPLRITEYRMVGHRRLVSRRSLIGLVIGILLGFNIASYIAIPAPNRTDIEISVIARNDGQELLDSAKFRVGAARIRRHKGIGALQFGKGCKDDVVSYMREGYEPRRRPQPKKNVVKSTENDNFDGFNLEKERLRRQKELEVFYESDIDVENDGGGLEEFQVPPNFEKYVDYEVDENGQNEEMVNVDNLPETDSDESHHKLQQPLTDRNHFLYVGVLTAQKYLTTRGRAIRHTWAPHVPGKVEFYVGENVNDVDDGAGDALPLVRLQSVQDDVYPPQKKSFLLLKRMYDAYLNSGYQWFMRADDDVYVNTEKLEMFLRRLNSSEPVYLGQTGLGNAEERGRLSLMHGENYCMGGPGMIFSREVLRRVGPHIRECVHQLYSWHEDVEISRCVRRFAGVNCAWSYQMQELFYEHYALRKGYIDPYDEPNNPKLHTAMTLHPNKNPAYQVKLHYFMRSQRIQQLMGKVKQLSRDVVELSSRLTSAIDVEHFMLGSPLTLNRFSPRHHADVIEWSFLTDRLLYSAPPRQPRRSLPIDLQLTIRNLVMQVMAMMNSNSRSRGRVIDFKQVGYGYRRVNPLYGAEYVLDLLLVYKRYKGKKMTIPVRRHAYLQQSFGRTEMREDYPINKHMMRAVLDRSRPNALIALINSLQDKSKRFLSAIGLAKHSNKKAASEQPVGTNGRKPEVDPLNKLRFDSSRSLSDDKGEETVNIIVPLSGRFDTFRSFMTNLENVSLSRGDPVSLLAIIFVGAESEYKLDARRTSELLDNYSKRYPLYDLRQIPINAKFSRGLALEIGASHFSNDSLLFFCDVDVVFDAEFSGKCRANTRRGVRVFYPVLFSEFHPKFEGEQTSWRFSSNDHNPRDLVKPRDNHFVIHGNSGHWRSYGYGLLCVYQSDFTATGGFDMTIQGWGLEDVDLVDKFIGVKRKDDQKRMDIMRVVEPSLVHVYHPSHCDPALTENQFRMCQASRASGITSITNLAEMWTSLWSNGSTVADPVSGIIPVHPASRDERSARRRTINQRDNFQRNGVR